jgi:broad specificity phosphatase PhoE
MKFFLVHHGGGGDRRRQAEAVAAELKALAARGERFEAVYCSPLPEAEAAASLVSEALSLPAPETRKEIVHLDGDNGSEAVIALQKDAWSMVEMLRSKAPEDASFVLVTHETAIRALVARALSMPLTEMHRFALDPGSMTTIEFRSQPRERILIAALNETCHLERAYRTA